MSHLARNLLALFGVLALVTLVGRGATLPSLDQEIQLLARAEIPGGYRHHRPIGSSRAVFELPCRRTAVRIDGAIEGCAGVCDTAGAAGCHHRGPGGRGNVELEYRALVSRTASPCYAVERSVRPLDKTSIRKLAFRIAGDAREFNESLG